MLNINSILSFFTPEVIQHPFKLKAVQSVELIEDATVLPVTWGLNKVVPAKKMSGTDFISWQLPDSESKRLSPTTLDEHDWVVIRSKKVSPDKYKLVKPYVIAQYSNKDIAAILKMSVSWCEKLTPRIKEAIKLRIAAT